MSRPTLSLFALDRPALKGLSADLRRLLHEDDRAGLATLLELGPGLAARLASGERSVDVFLRPESDPEVAPLFASLRRVAKKRALSAVWTSTEASLEGRLRQYDLLRAESDLAAAIDKLLDIGRLPWFLQRPGATGGWLDGPAREALLAGLKRIAPALPDELVAFVAGLDEVEGAVVAHDAL